MDKLNIRYEEILQNLKTAHRYQRPIDDELANEVLLALNSSSKETKLKALCCLQNTYTYSKRFHPALQTLLKNKEEDQEVVIHTLIACMKQVIERGQKKGERLSGEWVMIFKNFLSKEVPIELQLWALRLIASMGSQRLFYKDDLMQLKPSWIKTKLSRKQQEISKIIEHILIL